MDPCQRLLLEHGYNAFNGSGCDRAALESTLTGVFLGFAGTDFAQVLAASEAGSSVYAATGSSFSIACGRVSYTLGLHGPCASYDTACSAALTACGHFTSLGDPRNFGYPNEQEQRSPLEQARALLQNRARGGGGGGYEA